MTRTRPTEHSRTGLSSTCLRPRRVYRRTWREERLRAQVVRAKMISARTATAGRVHRAGRTDIFSSFKLLTQTLHLKTARPKQKAEQLWADTNWLKAG